MLSPDFDFELSLLPSGCRWLLGLDEVGRGPWAGPLTVGAFLIDLQTFSPDEFRRQNVRDSKTLSAARRQKLLKYFHQNGFNFVTFSAASTDIDKQGMSVCLSKLFAKALKHYRGSFDHALIDGNRLQHIKTGTSFVIKGDAKCFSIAAASIIAKVTRDALMDDFDRLYPVYGFARHKGYGTAFHQSALKAHGPCPIHRFSYRPVSNLVRQFAAQKPAH